MSSKSAIALDALGNPVRRQILRLVASDAAPVGVIADQLPISRPAVSKHLRILEAAELVTLEDVGRQRFVRLSPTGFDAAREWLDGFWDEALTRFALLAENTTPRQREATDE